MKRHEFDCDRCGYKVFKRQDEFDHDHCPECLWSLHTNFSSVEDAPCFTVMRPIPCTWQGLWPQPGCEMMWEYCMKCTYVCLQPVQYIATPAQHGEVIGLSVTSLETDALLSNWLDPFAEGKGAAIWTMVAEKQQGKPTGRFKWYRRILRPEPEDEGELPFATRPQFNADLKRAGENES